MKRIDLVEFNRELFQKMKEAGMKLEDFKYCDLYRDYLKMSETMHSRKEVILSLAQKHGYTGRQVYNILKHLEKSVNTRD